MKKLSILLAVMFFISCWHGETIKSSEREYIVFGEDTIVVEGRFNTYVSKTRFGCYGFFDSTLNAYVIEVKQKQGTSYYSLIIIDQKGNVDTIQGIDGNPAIIPAIEDTSILIHVYRTK